MRELWDGTYKPKIAYMRFLVTISVYTIIYLYHWCGSIENAPFAPIDTFINVTIGLDPKHDPGKKNTLIKI